ncbi:MAG TPA: DUF6788 family protein [Vicinamibacteria bacterium]|nr:DUF6788 family protein [Vicinamibacteria bacterium]
MRPEEIRQRVRERLQEQRALVEDLLRQREQLAGSLFVRFGVCGKEGCVCRTGQRHGPYYVLSTRSGGKGGFTYLEASQMAEARELVKAYREYRSGMRRLRRVGERLVVLLRQYQDASARRGTRRVGLRPQPQA